MEGVRFLRSVNLGEKVNVGKKVAVIGGGNTAIDCARTARRIGAKEVTIIYRRSSAEMPALAEDVAAVEHEGIKIEFLAAPKGCSHKTASFRGSSVSASRSEHRTTAGDPSRFPSRGPSS